MRIIQMNWLLGDDAFMCCCFSFNRIDFFLRKSFMSLFILTLTEITF